MVHVFPTKNITFYYKFLLVEYNLFTYRNHKRF